MAVFDRIRNRLPASRRDVRLVDFGLAVWVIAWLVAAGFVVHSITQLEEGGRAVVSAGEGIDETSDALHRAAGGLHETGRALGLLGELPFLSGDPGAAVEQTADDVERLARQARATAEDARTTGADAEQAASDLAIVLGLAVGIAPTLPVLLVYLLVRPTVAERLEAA